MQLSLPSKISSDLIGSPSFIGQVSRGQKYRHVGWVSVLVGIVVLVGGSLAELLSTQTQIWVGAGLVLSVALLNWTRIWVKESREPFKYTYSVAKFEQGPESAFSGSLANDPICWLDRDLIEKLGDRVRRLSLLADADVPQHDLEGDPHPHVHVSGWYGLRQAEDGEWWIEVVPAVRIGGRGAPAKLGNTVHFKLDPPAAAVRNRSLPPSLDVRQYSLLVERVYWAVASKIYKQIRRGVEEKAMLLPPGRLRAVAYLNEAHDYARSNTLDAFEAARKLYRKAREAYDRSAHRHPRTGWRKFVAHCWRGWNDGRSWLRRKLSRVMKRLGHREILAAEADLGYARMLVAEWNLRFLCGSLPKEIYEAPAPVKKAISRLEDLPKDINGRRSTLFQAYVTMALALSDLQDLKGATEHVGKATRLLPADAAENSEFLLGEALVAADPIRSLRLLTRAVERDPKHERARFSKAEQLERMWRRRDSYEPSLANVLDAEYAEVIAVDPGNLSAWANRGYVGWLLTDPEQEQGESEKDRLTRRQRALSSLQAGLRYKEVRGDAMVGELSWNLVRFRAEEGKFASAYENYVAAVSAMLGEPRMSFVDYFYRDATGALRRRFESYERLVREKATAATGKGDDRMVRSVLAFVLNDCGGAHHAYSLRQGSMAARRRALGLFEQAIDLSPAFVLPKFNLAVVEGEVAADETLPASDRAGFLNCALEHLWEVVQVEPLWTFSRLKMAELEALLPGLETEFEREPVTDEPPDLPLPEPQRWLGTLLPQLSLGVNGRVGGDGDEEAHVKQLLNRSKKIRWEKEFNEAQVTVLMQWASVLAGPAPEAAFALSSELRENLHLAHPLLLRSQLEAAERLRDSAATDKDRKRWSSKVEEMAAEKALYAFSDLRSDPVNFVALRNSFGDLLHGHRVEILTRAQQDSPIGPMAELLEEMAGGLRPVVAYAPPMSHLHLTPLAMAVLHVGRPESVLEIECGEGDGALFLAREFPRARVRGVDSSEETIRRAAARVGLDPEGRIAFKQGQPRSLPHAADNFDLVVAVDARPAPGEVARVLRAGGWLILASTDSGAASGIRDRRLRQRLAARGFEPAESEQAGEGSFTVFRLRGDGAPGPAL